MNKILRVFKEGWQGVKRHGAMSFASASAVTMTLLIIGAFFILNANIQKISSGIENSVEIHAKIENSLSEEEITALKTRIEALEGVKEVTFSSKDQELEYFIQSYGEQGELFRMYVGENNPMRNAFLIETDSGEYIQKVAEEVEKMSGIEKVNYGGAGTLTLLQSLHSFRTSGYVVVAGLGILAVLLIVNTIGATIEARADEIFIMRTVGASNGFIRWPFIIEGILIGFFGAVLPVLVLSVFYIYVYRHLGGYLFTEMFEMAVPGSFLGSLAALLFGAGITVGALGSFIAVSRKLWWKR